MTMLHKPQLKIAMGIVAASLLSGHDFEKTAEIEELPVVAVTPSAPKPRAIDDVREKIKLWMSLLKTVPQGDQEEIDESEKRYQKTLQEFKYGPPCTNEDLLRIVQELGYKNLKEFLDDVSQRALSGEYEAQKIFSETFDELELIEGFETAGENEKSLALKYDIDLEDITNITRALFFNNVLSAMSAQTFDVPGDEYGMNTNLKYIARQFLQYPPDHQLWTVLNKDTAELHVILNSLLADNENQEVEMWNKVFSDDEVALVRSMWGL